METNQFLGQESIGKLMKKYAVPCIISLLVGALYNIVDQIFIANAEYLGSYGNAANTVVFPLTVIALAIAVMIGDGCCAFVSLKLGMGEKDKAKISVGNSVVITVGSYSKNGSSSKYPFLSDKTTFTGYQIFCSEESEHDRSSDVSAADSRPSWLRPHRR